MAILGRAFTRGAAKPDTEEERGKWMKTWQQWRLRGRLLRLLTARLLWRTRLRYHRFRIATMAAIQNGRTSAK